MLSVSNLHVAVGGTEILKGLSLEIPAGEVHAVMGPNGAGKSTLSYTLAGRQGYEVTEGTASLNGEDLLAMAANERAAGGQRPAFTDDAGLGRGAPHVKGNGVGQAHGSQLAPQLAHRDPHRVGERVDVLVFGSHGFTLLSTRA
jgi:ABC-type glutathione transport system ATPase component